jgi:hypothetical protein
MNTTVTDQPAEVAPLTEAEQERFVREISQQLPLLSPEQISDARHALLDMQIQARMLDQWRQGRCSFDWDTPTRTIRWRPTPPTEPVTDPTLADLKAAAARAIYLLEQMMTPAEVEALRAETPEQRAAAIAETDRRLGLSEEVQR